MKEFFNLNTTECAAYIQDHIGTTRGRGKKTLDALASDDRDLVFTAHVIREYFYLDPAECTSYVKEKIGKTLLFEDKDEEDDKEKEDWLATLSRWISKICFRK